MSMFSETHGYSKIKSELIIEDAPMWLRTSYLEDVLSSYVQEHVFFANKYEYDPTPRLRDLNSLIDFIRMLSNALKTDFYSLISSNFNEDDNWSSGLWKVYLEIILRSIEWYEFYDVVELIGKELINARDSYISLANDETVSDVEGTWGELAQEFSYKIKAYIKDVNKLFTTNHVGWLLDEESVLFRTSPEELTKKLAAVKSEVGNVSKTVSEHVSKAEGFVTRRPLDPENSIKEIVIALESLGRKLYPKANNLTGVVIEMRKTDLYPQHLLNVMQDFYKYACDEPGIRHGKDEPLKVRLEDAEFCLHLGAALIQYINRTNKVQM